MLNSDLTIAIQEERRNARRLLDICRTAAENASRIVPVDPLQERHPELIAADSPDPSNVNLDSLNAEHTRALLAAETLLHDYPDIYAPAARSTIGAAESKRILDKHPDLGRASSGDRAH